MDLRDIIGFSVFVRSYTVSLPIGGLAVRRDGDDGSLFSLAIFHFREGHACADLVLIQPLYHQPSMGFTEIRLAEFASYVAPVNGFLASSGFFGG